MIPHNLVIIRTAFQGWLARQVLTHAPKMSYDLIQISYNDAPEERRQFEYLAAGAQRAKFLSGSARRFDFLTHIDLWRRLPAFVTERAYNQLFLSSIDAPVIGAIASRHKTSGLVTWDDGIANLVPDGHYRSGQFPWRSVMLRRALRATPIEDLRHRIETHFTIFGALPNIVNPDRVCMIRTTLESNSMQIADNILCRYFIGQPFDEAMSTEDVRWVESEAQKFKLDWYVKHPRECMKLALGIPELDKAGDIAEEAIIRHAAGRPFELVGAFSSTLFTMSQFAERTVMLLPQGLKNRNWIVETGNKLGAKTVSPGEHVDAT